MSSGSDAPVENAVRDSSDLHSAIRAARIDRGMTQGELAKRLGVTQGTISFWESGTESPTVEHIMLLALEMPELIESFRGRERQLLERVLRLERQVFAGRCACAGCRCDGSHS